MQESLRESLLEEIALEGLDGITLQTLFLRCTERKEFPLKIDEGSKSYIWKCILGLTDVQFYKLQQPRPDLVAYNRFHYIDPETHHFLETEHIPDDIYPVEVVDEEGVFGSCPDYKTRENVSQTIRDDKPTLQAALEMYGSSLVVAANQDIRIRTILGPNNDPKFYFTNVTYCVLERIGRYSGETSIGKRSLQALNQSPKSLFYHLKKTRCLEIIKKQRLCTIKKPSNSKITCVLYHLKRFYTKVGNKQQMELMAMVEYLSKMPEQMCEPCKMKNVLKIYDKDFKKVSQLSVSNERIFEYLDVPYRELHPDAKPKEYLAKNQKVEKVIRHIRLLKTMDELKRALDQNDSSDEEEEEEEEEVHLDDTPALSFQREFDLPYMYQILDVIKRSGSRGLSQTELQKILNANRLCVRRAVNFLLRTACLRSIMQDRGRQKIIMYVPIEFAKENKIHLSLTAEIEKYGDMGKESMVNDFLGERKSKKGKPKSGKGKAAKQAPTCTFIEEPPSGEKISEIHKELDKVDEGQKLENISQELKAKKEILRQIISEDGSLMQVKLEELHKPKPDVPVLGLKRFGSMLSESHIRRINWIIEVVAAIKAVETFRILKLLRNREKDMNMNYLMDSKSLHRLVVALIEEKKIRCFHVQIKMEDKTKDLKYICCSTVDEKNEFLLRLIDEAKLKYFSVSKEQLNKRRQQNKEEQLLKKTSKQHSVDVPQSARDSIKSHQEYRRKLATCPPPMKYNRKAGLKYGLLPKMLRIQAAHQYLFHLVYDTHGHTILSEGGVINPDAAKVHELDVTAMNAADKVIQPSVTIKEDGVWPVKDPPVYFDEFTWRRYLPPLQVHVGYTRGWCLLSDVLLKLPVYLFCQIVNVCYDIDGLEDVLQDSKKKFYPVINLPWRLSQQLLHSKKYVHSFLELCSYLCEMGLLSYGKEFLKEIEQTFVYVHQNASLIDTRDSLKGYNKIMAPDNVVFQTRPFHFDKLSDLHDYWENLQIISLASNLGYKSRVHDDLEDKVSFEKRRLKDAVKAFSPDNIIDDGVIPGDGRGAGGVDSSLFVHCLKNWTFRSLSKTAVGEKIYGKHHGPPGLRGLDVLRERKKVDFFNQGLKLKGKERLYLSDNPKKPIEIKKVIREHVKGNRGGKGIKRILNHTRTIRREDGRLRLKRTVNYAPKKLKKKPFEKGDAKDREIYALKTKQRVVWSDKEDSTLLMCRLATLIMDDNRKTAIVSYPTIRDYLHENCGLISHDKSSQACNRRLKFVLKNKATENNILLYFREALQDEYIVKNYVAKQYVVTDIAVVPSFKELTGYLIEKFQTLNVQKCTLPKTLQELVTCQIEPIDKLSIRKQYKDVTNKEDICKDVLRNILHSAVLLQDKQGRTHEMFKLLTQYPDQLLSEVIKELRSDGLFVIQKKQYQREALSQLHTGLGLRNFKVSQRYMYNYKHRYLSTLFEESAEFLEQLCQCYKENRGMTLDFHPKGGQSAILIPLVLQNKIKFKLKLPEELVVIDMDGFYKFPWGRGKVSATKADRSLQDHYSKKTFVEGKIGAADGTSDVREETNEEQDHVDDSETDTNNQTREAVSEKANVRIKSATADINSKPGIPKSKMIADTDANDKVPNDGLKDKSTEAMETETDAENQNIDEDPSKADETTDHNMDQNEQSEHALPIDAEKKLNEEKATGKGLSRIFGGGKKGKESKVSKQIEYETYVHGTSTVTLPKYEHKTVDPIGSMEVNSHASIASRTLLSLRRVEDTQFYSFEDIRVFNAQDNFVVRSCEIDVEIRDDGPEFSRAEDGVGGMEVEGRSDSEEDYKKSVVDRLQIPKQKMKQLWSEMNRLLPFKLDINEVWQSMTDQDGEQSEELIFCKQIYQIIEKSGELGIKMFHLQEKFPDSLHWKAAVKTLVHYAACPEQLDEYD